MFKKARLKFIAVTMAIVIIIFGFFFGAAYLIFRRAYTDSIVDELTINEKSYFDGIEHFRPNILIVTLPRFANQLPEVKHGGNNFKHETIKSIIDAVLIDDIEIGAIGDVYYRVGTQNGERIIVASDVTEKLNAMRSNILITVGVMGFILLVVTAITVLASNVVIRPLKDSFYKQQQFVSDASHELKTPVAIISANADVLKNVIGDNNYLESIKSQSERLEYLVSDMLTLAKGAENKIKVKEHFSLTEETLGATLPYEALLFENGKTLVLDVDENANYFGVMEDFRTVINILMDNAIKHSSKNATVKVTLKKDGSKFVLKVFNTGSFIPDEHSNKIFERFYRGDGSRARNLGGSGLGLSIAKSVADGNKWKIFAKSKYMQSMTITVIL